jgi:hypothetical protein
LQTAALPLGYAAMRIVYKFLPAKVKTQSPSS